MKITLLIVVILLIDASDANSVCYVTNSETNQQFKLVWQDEFDHSLDENWLLVEENERHKCGNNIGQMSCNRAQNAKVLHSNFLALYSVQGYNLCYLSSPETNLAPYPWHRLVIQIGVGGNEDIIKSFPQPIPEKFENFNWKCPVLIIDYVRIYEIVPIESGDGLKKCEIKSDQEDLKLVDSICAMDRSMWMLLKDNWILISIVICAMLFLCLIIYLLLQLSSIKSKLETNPSPESSAIRQLNTALDDLYDLPIYIDEEECSQMVGPKSQNPTRIQSYLSIHDGDQSKSNEYMPMEQLSDRESEYSKLAKSDYDLSARRTRNAIPNNNYDPLWSANKLGFNSRSSECLHIKK